jgi:predicted nuclease of predicted toxin-antitoxin system
MKFKLDENLGTGLINMFADHDIKTVYDEKLSGCEDDILYKKCRGEGRCLITFDKDFSNIKRFPSKNTEGIVVLRTPVNPSLTIIKQIIYQLLEEIKNTKIKGSLWIVEPGRIRIRKEVDEE